MIRACNYSEKRIFDKYLSVFNTVPPASRFSTKGKEGDCLDLAAVVLHTAYRVAAQLCLAGTLHPLL